MIHVRHKALKDEQSKHAPACGCSGLHDSREGYFQANRKAGRDRNIIMYTGIQEVSMERCTSCGAQMEAFSLRCPYCDNITIHYYSYMRLGRTDEERKSRFIWYKIRIRISRTKFGIALSKAGQRAQRRMDKMNAWLDRHKAVQYFIVGLFLFLYVFLKIFGSSLF